MKIGYNLLSEFSHPEDFLINNFINSSNNFEHILFRYNFKRKRIEWCPYLNNLEIQINKSTIYREIFLPFSVRESGIDILISSSNAIPLRQPTKTIALISDVDEMRNYIKHYKIKKTNRIIVKSYSSQKEIIKTYKLSPARISVIEMPPNPVFAPIFDENKVVNFKNKCGINGNYIMLAGSFSNTSTFQDLHKLFKVFSQSGISIVAVNKSKSPPLKEFCKKHSTKMNKILYLEITDNHELALIYNGSSGFINISSSSYILEIVEALFCGTPIISTPNSFVKETSVNAAIIADSYSIFSANIKRINEDENLYFKLRTAAIERSKYFSIEKSVKCLSNIIEEVNKEEYYPDG